MAADLGHCQCHADPGRECLRTPTAEDLLCDLCRMTQADPSLTCFTVFMNGERIDGMRHGQTQRVLQADGTGVWSA